MLELVYSPLEHLFNGIVFQRWLSILPGEIPLHRRGSGVDERWGHLRRPHCSPQRIETPSVGGKARKKARVSKGVILTWHMGFCSGDRLLCACKGALLLIVIKVEVPC